MGKKKEREQAKQIATNMAAKGKSAEQIANRISNKTNVSSSAAQNIASRAASPGPSTGGNSRSASSGPSIAGVRTGGTLNRGEVQKLLDSGLSSQQIRKRAGNKNIKLAGGAKRLLRSASIAPNNNAPNNNNNESVSVSVSRTGSGDGAVAEVSTGGGNQIPYSEYDLFGDIAGAQVQNEGLVAVERIRQAGATERLKYEVDNRIPEIQAESKGRLDLQAIVNAGYKNIANIERGSDMVRNITSMFSF